jgi:hypothetical protein
MKHARLELARSADILPPLNDEVAVFGQIELERLRGLDFANIRAVSDSFVTSKMLSAAGIESLMWKQPMLSSLSPEQRQRLGNLSVWPFNLRPKVGLLSMGKKQTVLKALQRK